MIVAIFKPTIVKKCVSVKIWYMQNQQNIVGVALLVFVQVTEILGQPSSRTKLKNAILTGKVW